MSYLAALRRKILIDLWSDDFELVELVSHARLPDSDEHQPDPTEAFRDAVRTLLADEQVRIIEFAGRRPLGDMEAQQILDSDAWLDPAVSQTRYWLTATEAGRRLAAEAINA